MRTPNGKPFRGVSRYTSRELDLKLNLNKERLVQRQTLQSQLGAL